jgi:hypothetical protein
VNPDVKSPHIYTIKTSLVSTANDHVVHLTLVAGVEGQMELRRINKGNVMDGEIRHFTLLVFD